MYPRTITSSNNICPYIDLSEFTTVDIGVDAGNSAKLDKFAIRDLILLFETTFEATSKMAVLIVSELFICLDFPDGAGDGANAVDSVDDAEAGDNSNSGSRVNPS